MPLLFLVNLAIIAACFLFLYTQILTPWVKSKPLFPLFRSTPIKDKVEETRDKVADLREQVEAQRDLANLEAEKTRLEKQLGVQSADSASTKTE